MENPNDVVCPSGSTRETVVDDLWREGWFLKSAKGLFKRFPHVDAHDVALEAVETAIAAAKSWNGEQEVQSWVKWRSRNRMLDIYRRTVNELAHMSTWDLNAPMVDDGDITLLDKVMPHVRSTEDEVIYRDQVRVLKETMPVLTDKQRRYVEDYFLLSQKVRRGNELHGHWRPAKVKFRRAFGLT